MRLRDQLRCVLGVIALGCGPAPDAQVAPAADASAEAPSTPASAKESPAVEPARHPGLAPLRPEGADSVLDALRASPADAGATARAALFYAKTNAGGMTLLWGLTYAALQPNGPERVAVGKAMAQVLNERVTAKVNGSNAQISTKLAPGDTPVIAEGDTTRAPVAHLFEMTFGPSLVSFKGTWTLDAAVTTFGGYVKNARQGTVLDPHVELHAWLFALADAGHLDAFLADAFGPGFAGEPSQAAKIPAARAYVQAHPFKPTHAVLPDDLLPFPPRR